MTAEDLASLGLTGEALEQVLALHDNELQTLCEQRDSLRQQLDRANERWESHRAAQLRQAVTETLIRRGAHPQAAELLAQRCGPVTLDEEGRIAGEEALVAPLMDRWPGLFTRVETLGTGPVDPPLGAGGLMSPQAIRDLSPQEINRSWPRVKESLCR